MRVGSKSLIVGVHQFPIHNITVLLAWRKLYGAWPEWWQLVAIFCHDLGYANLKNIDGAEGKQHPHRGAMLASRVVGWIKSWGPGSGVLLGAAPFCIHTYFFTLLHSRDMAKARGMPVSKLCAADKYSIVFDPAWFYLLRARLSGEIKEFKHRAIVSGHLAEGDTDRQWYNFYRAHVLARPDIQELLKD